MTDHLPECPCHGPNYDPAPPCICRALRACEARVRQDMALQYLVTDREQQEAEQRAYAAGVQAARDAVANLPVAITVVHDTPFLNKQGMGVCENPDKYPHGIVQVAALAAIDALRGDA